MAGRVAWAVGCCAALCACSEQYDPCFDRPEVVRDLRILGVRADPPQALADLASGTVQSVQVQALIVDGAQQNEDSLQLGAAACVPDTNGGCLAMRTIRELQPAPPDAPPFPFAAPADLIAAALQADPLHGFGGAAQVGIALDVTDGLGNKARAYKTLLYSAPDATQPPNHGFDITGLRIRRLSRAWHQVPDDAAPPYPDGEIITQTDPLHLDLYDAVWLRPILAPGPGATEAAELYTTTDYLGRTVQVRETITYSFYTSFGTPSSSSGGVGCIQHSPPICGTNVDDPRPRAFFDNPTASEPIDGEDPAGVVQFQARLASYGTLWVVARDSRGAEAWASFNWTVRDATFDTGLQPQIGPGCFK